MFTGITSFIVVFGTLSLISWSFYTVIVSQISNIEKAFVLSSSETGWLLTIWELGYIIFLVIASYFGPRAHLPRAIGLATILCGLSGFIFALPHFVAFSESNINTENKNETETSDDSDVTLCLNSTKTLNGTLDDSGSTSLKHSVKGSSKTIAYVLFNIAMIVQGAGKSPCYPYSAQYVDDNVDKQKTGFYIGTISSIAVFGLALGYGIGSLISSVYVTLESTTLSSTDIRFIGAWWLGVIVIGLATILISVPMFFFPRRFKSGQSEPTLQHATQRHISIIDEIKLIATAVVTIMKSSVYLLSLIAVCFQILAFSTFLGFEPKYIETQFAIPPWQVNVLLGVISITSYSLGYLIGGYITKRWNLSPFRTILVIISLLSFVTIVLIISAFLGCSQQDIYGAPTDQTSGSVGLDCDCSTSEILPICGNDGKNYFSPCHSGCTNLHKKVLTNCPAIPGGAAKMGLCPSRCSIVWPYSVAKFVLNLADAVASIPVFLVFLRSAGPEHKALAIGLSAAVKSITAWLPGPVIGGKLIDSTCLIWNTATTSGKYCAYYNIEWQRYKMHGLMIGFRVVALLFLCLALVRAKRLPNWPTEGKEYKSADTQENGKQLEHLKHLLSS